MNTENTTEESAVDTEETNTGAPETVETNEAAEETLPTETTSEISELQAKVEAILEDGIIDDAEVADFKAFVTADGVIDRKEADAFFEINDAITDKEGNSEAWPELFATSIADHVLADEETPNVIDEDEATYLVNRIKGDGQVDSTEKLLLTTIKSRATIIHPTLGAFMEEQGI